MEKKVPPTPKFHTMSFMFYILKHLFMYLNMQKLSLIKSEQTAKSISFFNIFHNHLNYTSCGPKSRLQIGPLWRCLCRKPVEKIAHATSQKYKNHHIKATSI